MTTVNSCPFCGHDNVEIGEVGIGEFAVDCPECMAIGPITGDIMSAIAQWNGALLANHKFVSVTPAGGGDISPAVADRATSLASNSGEAAAVVEPPKLDDVPAEARSDEIDIIGSFNAFDRALAERNSAPPPPGPPPLARCVTGGLVSQACHENPDSTGLFKNVFKKLRKPA